MAPDGIVEAVDGAPDPVLGFSPALEDGAPDQLGFQGLEEGLDNRVIVAVPVAGHRDLDGMLSQRCLIGKRAVLASAVRMMDQRSGHSPASAGLFGAGRR